MIVVGCCCGVIGRVSFVIILCGVCCCLLFVLCVLASLLFVVGVTCFDGIFVVCWLG